MKSIWISSGRLVRPKTEVAPGELVKGSFWALMSRKERFDREINYSKRSIQKFLNTSFYFTDKDREAQAAAFFEALRA